MPTYERDPRFLRDWARLTSEQRVQFQAAVQTFVADLKAGHGVRPSLGIKRFEGQEGVWEFAWASDGRALFRYGSSPQIGDVHIVWLRIGTHDIYKG